MKKSAAFLFIPIFFAFGYFHEYHFPHFGFFSQPHDSSVADSNTNNDIYSSGSNNSSVSDNTSSSDSDQTPTQQTSQSYSNQTTSGNTFAGQGSDTSAVNSTMNAATASNLSNTSSTPGVPNTGAETSPPTPATQNISPPIMPPTYASVPPNNPGLTIFPQPGPAAQLPPPTTLANISAPDVTSSTTAAPPTTLANVGVSPDTSSSTTPPSANASASTPAQPEGSSTPVETSPTPTPTPTPAPPSTSTPQQETPPPSNNASSSADTTTSTGETSPPPPSTPVGGGNIFSTGGVTFRFDDGIQSQYDVAFPALQAAGFKGTFYIITHQLGDQGFSGYMTSSEVKQLAAAGEDIGDHTQTHPHLTTLSQSQQQTEIVGALHDLQGMGINPTSFSYPFGEYSATTMQIVKSAGLSSAVTTVETPASPASDPFQIESPSLAVTDTPAKVEQMIQNAIANHQWLILTFHDIDTRGDQYSMTPANFRAIVQYVAEHHIPVVTVAEGAAQLGK